MWQPLTVFAGLAFDRLAKMEAQREDAQDATTANEPVVKTEEGGKEQEEEEEPEDEDLEEDEFEDDDYLQVSYLPVIV